MAEWVRKLYASYVKNALQRKKIAPTEEALEQEFEAIWQESRAKLMVQEPWMGTIRFKTLAVYDAEGMRAWIDNPLPYLAQTFGGGKYKINFYHRASFVATRNFRPEGEPKWAELPEVETDL